MAGRASGRNRLEWPLGKWALKTGQGEATVEPPAGHAADDARAAGRSGRGARARFPTKPGRSIRSCRSATCRSPATSSIRSIRSGFASRRAGRRPSRTYVEFEGQTAYGEQSRIPFHVTQPGLAGERPRARRDHDGVRVADRARCRWAATASSTACCSRRSSARASRARSRASGSGPGTSSGAPAARTSRSRTATSSCRTRR